MRSGPEILPAVVGKESASKSWGFAFEGGSAWREVFISNSRIFLSEGFDVKEHGRTLHASECRDFFGGVPHRAELRIMNHQHEHGGPFAMTLRLDDGENADSGFAKGARNLREHAWPVIDR
jgi:hypothetical protein